MNNRSYNVWDCMKVAAILLVVVGHVTRMYTPQGVLDIGVYPTALRLITSFIYSFHMPAFFAVSGAVYYINKVEKGKYSSQSHFAYNKMMRLLIPYFAFSLFWVFPTMMHLGLVNDPIGYIIDSYVLGKNPRHLWFLLVLFEIFIVFNLFCKIILKHRMLTIVLLCLLYFCKGLLPSIFQLSNFCGYFVFFYIGFLFASREHCVQVFMDKHKYVEWLLPLVWVGFHIAAWYLHGIPILFSVFSMFSAIAGSILLYEFCRRLIEWGHFCGAQGITRIAVQNSFGIYLFHPMIIYLLFFHAQQFWMHPYLLCFSILILTVSLSLVLTLLVRKCRVGAIIGE